MANKFLISLLLITLLSSYINSKPAIVRVFMEAKCRFCKNFIATKFKEFTQNKDRHEIATVYFYPFGNAKETDNGDGTYTVECQHGPLECRGNLIENCALYYLNKDLDSQYNFMICLEANADLLDNDFDKALEVCLADRTLTGQIQQCANGPLGNQLHHESALRTPKNKRYVPYITVDEVHQEDAEDDLSYYLCGLDEYAKLDGCAAYNTPLKFLFKKEEGF